MRAGARRVVQQGWSINRQVGMPDEENMTIDLADVSGKAAHGLIFFRAYDSHSEIAKDALHGGKAADRTRDRDIDARRGVHGCFLASCFG
jgi:hypothetical protein